MTQDLENLVRDFNTEDYKFICNTAIKSIQFAWDHKHICLEWTDWAIGGRVHIFTSMFRSECERILRIMKITRNRAKNGAFITMVFNVHYELEGNIRFARAYTQSALPSHLNPIL